MPKPTFKTPRDAAGAVVATFRTRRPPHRGVRTVAGIELWEDPAPQWVAELCAAVRESTGAERDKGYALMLSLCRWCDEGEPLQRSKRILTVLEHWVGPRCKMLRAFVTSARQHGGGEIRKDEGHWQPISAANGWLLREWGLPVRAHLDTKWKTLLWVYRLLQHHGHHFTSENARMLWQHQRALHAAYRLGQDAGLFACWDELQGVQPDPADAVIGVRGG